MSITAISGNKITVTRGSSPKTSCMNPFGITNGSLGDSDYLVHPSEEDDFSRTLYAAHLNSAIHTLRTVDGSSASISNPDSKGVHLLSDAWMEPNYVLRPFHLSMAYDEAASRINLSVDGNPIDCLTFSEKKMRRSKIVGDGSVAKATIYLLGNHNFDSDEVSAGTVWVKLYDGGSFDGIWKVNQIVDDTTFAVTLGPNLITSTDNSAGFVTDVSIRENNTIVDFKFSESNCYLGSNGNDTLYTRRPSQFMGEFHELCITEGYKDNFASIDTLLPNYRNTLLYFRFEEANQ